jgi:hypothetical protein
MEHLVGTWLARSLIACETKRTCCFSFAPITVMLTYISQHHKSVHSGGWRVNNKQRARRVQQRNGRPELVISGQTHGSSNKKWIREFKHTAAGAHLEEQNWFFFFSRLFFFLPLNVKTEKLVKKTSSGP